MLARRALLRLALAAAAPGARVPGWGEAQRAAAWLSSGRQGLSPVPFGSGLAPEGAPAAEGLPERFASPAERPTPSYSSMEEVD
ncbi:hypothetical protein AAES_49288 [Amazona aestiva]|uniref:Uncharacterized protein n=1 Tax=Amazona aestiva TaxID=12930 RepID=A0A0Q3Q879_AMAAE|nr:hypothetical protein AAES_49288 [Amazona aestiva]